MILLNTGASKVETGKLMPPLKSLIKIAKTLDVPLDALVNSDGAATAEVNVKDKSLFDKVRLIDGLPDSEKNMVLQIIDLAPSKRSLKKFCTRSQKKTTSFYN